MGSFYLVVGLLVFWIFFKAFVIDGSPRKRKHTVKRRDHDALKASVRFR